MIAKYVVLAILSLFLVTSSDPYFGFELGKRVSPSKAEDEVTELRFFSQQESISYLRDRDSRVNSLFKIDDFYFPNVKFWFFIYTQLESTQVAIHDRNDLSIIYKVLDFSSLSQKGLNSNTLFILQQKLSQERVTEIKKILHRLTQNPTILDAETREIHRALRSAGVQLPQSTKDRSAFFKELRDNLRIQTGQRNFIRAGLERSLPYQAFLGSYFEDRGLPKELTAIPFLESSFNPRAHSRVSALGVWQFMPLIASYYLPKRTPLIDYRSNVGLSSIAAARLLSENHRILKKWDLTVTSYNSGTKHLVKSRRKLASLDDINLEAIIRHSSSSAFGFASKNFYSEFLALVHVLAYEDELFPEIRASKRSDAEDGLVFSISKCPMRIDKELDKDFLEEIDFYNDQIRELKKIWPKGTIFTSKRRLPASKFFEVGGKNLVKIKPKDWPGLVRNQSCSTR